MTGTFSQQVVLVTGGGSGLGRDAAEAFAREGAQVIVADLVEGKARETEASIREAGGHAVAHVVDVASSASVDELFRMIRDRFGRLDIAVNGAGISGNSKSMAEMDDQDFDRVIAINLRGVWLCMSREMALFSAQGSGVIVNIASALGLIALPGCGAYCASKQGVIGLTKAGALDVAGQGIRVNAVCPGVIDTPMNSGVLADPDYAAQLRAMHPLNRVGRAPEISSAILWLASPGASFVTGAAIPVDGGWTTR